MSNTGQTYTKEFKTEAVKLSFNSDKPVERIAANLGVSKSILHRWRTELKADPDQAFPGNGQQKERDAEVTRLKKDLKESQMESEMGATGFMRGR